LKDVIFEMRPMEELHSAIVEKIIKHNITQFHIERNTDTSLKTLLEKMCFERGYTNCKFTEIYTTKVKKDKIADNEAAIRNNMVFPEFGLYGMGHQMRNFMKYFTGYSYLVNNKYDDAPDSVSMYAEKFVRQSNANAKAHCLQL
jgi:predicted phage terminase large subunit-like protein